MRYMISAYMLNLKSFIGQNIVRARTGKLVSICAASIEPKSWTITAVVSTQLEKLIVLAQDSGTNHEFHAYND